MDRHTTDNAWQSLFAVFWRGDVSEDLGRARWEPQACTGPALAVSHRFLCICPSRIQCNYKVYILVCDCLL